jgi:type IV secretory pathway VirB4 component
MGYNRNTVFFDVFIRNEERLNGNMFILGESGAGKSFTLKKLITEYASRGVRIYILDPEDEYRYITTQFAGNYLDVAGTNNTKINLLQIFPSLKDTDSDVQIDDLQQQRIFFEQIVQIIFPAMPIESRLYLNRLIGELYTKFGINSNTDIMKLKNEDFPICDDLLNLVCEYAENEKYSPGERQIYRSLKLFIEQLAGGGVYSNIWNGHTSLKLENTLNVLNFRSLFGNNNRTVANAQMLLVMRFLNLEIIRNKTRNDLHAGEENYVASRCMIIADEAHNFIDSKFPVALDFMKIMSKQIRKYAGVFWIATQNIGDFVGQTEEVKAKATAVIDNCKLALIFGLQPNDINTMIELYKSSRAFTEKEKEILRNGKRGKGLLKINDKTRIPIQIEAFPEQRAYFEADSVPTDEEEVNAEC